MSKYLRWYPVLWPEFSAKNHVKDADGWWNPKPRRRFLN